MKLTTLLSKITPLPYSVSGNSIVKGSYVCIAVIEDDGGYEAPIDERTANAAYLVHAANVMPELVEALKSARRSHHAEGCKLREGAEFDCNCHVGKAIDALASAEEVNTTTQALAPYDYMVSER